MGVISIEQNDCLYWLGRYTERVYTTLKVFEDSFDRLIDTDENAYADFCRRMEIPNIYTSGYDFVERYVFDETNPDSIYSNLLRAYDNAIVLRETIGSDSLAYIQLAIYEIQRTRGSKAPLIGLMKVIDNLVAFWGMTDDGIHEHSIRSIMKTGRRVERVDLYGRLHESAPAMKNAVLRLTKRITRTDIKYSEEVLKSLNELVEAPEIDYDQIVYQVERILEV